MPPMTAKIMQQIKAADPAHGDAADVGGERRIDVDFTEREFFGDAGMALAAGPNQVGAVDGGTRIARGQNVVHAVATGAVGDDLRTEFGSQPVIAGKIGAGRGRLRRRTPAKGARLRGSGRRWSAARFCACNRRVGIEVRLDGVNAVAIGADRRLRVAAGDGLPVDALHELGLHRLMALGAGQRNVELEDGRFLVAGAADFVHAVAVGADGGLGGSVGDRAGRARSARRNRTAGCFRRRSP